MISSIFTTVVALLPHGRASPHFDPVRRIMRDANGACVRYLTAKKRGLPDPLAVLLDLDGRRVLFAVARDQVDTYPFANPDSVRIERIPEIRETEGWRDELRAMNDAELAGAPASSVWIDVTSAWNGFARMFVAIDDYVKGDRSANCHVLAADMNDVPALRFSAPEYVYLERDYVELDPRNAADADVAHIYRPSFNRGLWIEHSFVPVPGTSWVIDKPGGGPVRIVRRTVAERYTMRDRPVVRYFGRRANLTRVRRVKAEPDWMSYDYDSPAPSVLTLMQMKALFDPSGAYRRRDRDLILASHPRFSVDALAKMTTGRFEILLPSLEGPKTTQVVEVGPTSISIDVTDNADARRVFAVLLSALHLFRVEVRGLMGDDLLTVIRTLRTRGPWTSERGAQIVGTDTLIGRYQPAGRRRRLVLYDRDAEFGPPLHQILAVMIRYLEFRAR